MPINESLIAELRHESTLSRKMLERVPLDNPDWKPHDKSMAIGRLATHVCETLKWISVIRHIDNFDFLRDYNFSPAVARASEELLSVFDSCLNAALNDLSEMNVEDFDVPWSVSRGAHLIMTQPKKVAIRSWGFSHHIHHRGQLSVYLRLLNVAVPGMYGPSADER